MCMTGSPAQAGSLSYETIDAQTFASWGADLLKYDNCYSEASAGYPDVDYTPAESPLGRYSTMKNALQATGRPIVYQICEWGVDFPSAWAPTLGNSWRITNDIIPSYRTIPRILNQAVPQTSFAGPGQWLDLDMLEVGNNVFTNPEEQTHFSLWAIIKSPLVIGTALKDSSTSINSASLAILKNSAAVSYNQDSLGVAASFKRRWTSDYEIWAGPLSGGRTVVAITDLSNKARDLTLNLPDVGLQAAATVKDIWNSQTASNVVTSYTGAVGAHGTLLLELGGTTTAGQYLVSNAKLSGNTATFSNIYGETTSSNYTLTLTFSQVSSASSTVTINNVAYTRPASSTTFSAPLSLTAANNNVLAITSSPLPVFVSLKSPSATFYPSTSFSLSGSTTRTTCSSGLCQPVGSKIGYLSSTNSASLTINAPSTVITSSSSKLVNIYFCNNDIAISTSWTTGTNTRNLTLTVNGQATRVELPLSGRSSELFSPGLGWQDTGTFEVLVPGWVKGSNVVVVGNANGNQGLVDYGADFVGMDVYW